MKPSESFQSGILKVSDLEEFENVLNGSCQQKKKSVSFLTDTISTGWNEPSPE